METNLSKIIFHVDVNSAFLSWSAVDRILSGETIDIRDKVAVIGGDEDNRRGVVLAKSNLAKKYGIVTGESLFSARKKCGELLVIPPKFSVYKKFSRDLLELLKNYSPSVEQFSIDEAFLDMGRISETEALALANEIRERVKRELGFTVNIGISENKVLAKMASEFNKPDKVNTLFKREIKKKLWPLPVNELFMVGKRATEKLNKMYIFTIGDLANYDVDLLKEKLKSYGEMIWNYANGVDNSKVFQESSDPKNISNATTLAEDVVKEGEALSILKEICEQVALRLRKEEMFCTGIAVNIKNRDFISYSHQKKIENPTNSSSKIFEVVSLLFKSSWRKDPIRLLGVSLFSLTEECIQQLSLFDEGCKDIEKEIKLNKLKDSIKDKYGNKIIR